MREIKLAVLCDFDGTITKTDVGHQIYTKFGDDQWREVNESWRRGEISSKDCLIGEYSFMSASEQEVREYVLEMEIDLGFLDLVKTCRDNDIPIAIASDGFDFYIHTILEKYGLSDLEVFCNEMQFNGRKVELSFPYYDQGCGICGNCKKLHVQRFKEAERKVIYIGDGLSDRFAARASDVIFAKSELMKYLVENGVDFIQFSDLGAVNRWVAGLLAKNIQFPSPSNGRGSVDPCQEVTLLGKNKPDQKKKSEKKNDIKKYKMKKSVEDMVGDRYIVYYEWSQTEE